MRTIIIGVGNPIVKNDGAGIQVVNELRRKITDPRVFVDIAHTGGFPLVEMMKGYDKAILVDTIREHKETHGDVKRYTLFTLPKSLSGTPHDASLTEAYTMMKELGDHDLPREVVVYGIVSNKELEFGEHFDHDIEKAVPQAVTLVLSELEKDQGSGVSP